MDIQRDPPRSRRKYVIGAAAFIVLILATMGINRLRPAAIVVDRSILAFDTVRVSDLVRDVRGPGTLTPEHTRIIVATAGGRVESLPARPGDNLTPLATVVVLSNPDVELNALQVEQQLSQARGALAQLRGIHEQQEISQASSLAQLRTLKLDAERQARVLDTLDRSRLASRNEVEAAHDKAAELATRYDLERRRTEAMKSADALQIKLAEQQIGSLEGIVKAQRSRVASMRVTAGEAGQLQSLGSPQLELGQWVNSGTELARISQPGRLKAVLRIPDVQARDVAIGQHATIDTHDGTVDGVVSNIDPVSRAGAVTVEVSLAGDLPKGARVDLAVDGAIEIERLHNVMHVGRPAYGGAQSTLRLFKVIPNSGDAVRTDVRIGKTTVTGAEVLGGLAKGDSVIISDVSLMLTEPRIHLRGTP